MRKIISFILVFLLLVSLCTFVSRAEDLLIKEDEYSNEGVKITADSVNGTSTGGYDAEKAIDGKLNTWWHSVITPKKECPHQLILTLPSTKTIYGLRYYPRPDRGAGICTKYEIHISSDGKAFDKVAEGSWDYTADAKTVYFGKAVEALVVKFVMTEAHGGFGSAAEIKFINEKGKDKAATTGNTAGNTNVITVKKPGEPDELTPTNYKFEASSVTYAHGGVPWDTPERTVDGDLNTYWHTTITPKAELPHIMTIILPKTEVISGFRYYPRAIGGAGVCTKYEIRISTDGVNYELAAEGMWANDASAKDAIFDENVAARYVKFIMLEAHGGFGNAGEIRLLKKDDSKPMGKGTENYDARRFSDDEVSVDGWTFDTSSTNAHDGVPYEKPEKTIDGNLVTHWHSSIEPKAEGPHYITTIFPEPTYISGYRYYPRANGEAGICKQYELYVSANGTDFIKVSEGAWKMDKTAKEVDFLVNIEAKAVKLVILEGQYGFGSAGEIRAIGGKKEYYNIPKENFGVNFADYKIVSGIFDSMIVTTSIEGQTYYVSSFISDMEEQSLWTTGDKSVFEGVADIAPPVDINYKFGYPYTISGIKYVPRQDEVWRGKGHFKTVEVEISEDGVNYSLFDTLNFDTSDLESTKYMYFKEPVKTRHLRFHIVECVGDMAAVAELQFLQTGVQNALDNINDEETFVLRIGSGDISVKKGQEEKKITIDVAPYIYNGSTMIPLRGLLEEMGASIGWDGETQKITVNANIGKMVFGIEDDAVYINNIRYNTPVAPQITDSRTFIPLRFISENLGYNVYWNGETQEIRISNK